ncbi:MAG: AraC family transcriptional regulator [Geminicoccaceae bacterium]
MTPVEKAVWYIESHFAEDIGLDDVALVSGVSRFHLSRAFGLATGRPVMRYLRGRRLSEAARRLADGAPDILSVALDAGYGSHEAFTRAFRDQFGATPDAVRTAGDLSSLSLVEPHRMDDSTFIDLTPPRFVEGDGLLLAGLNERYDPETSRSIPALWQRFLPWFGQVPGQVGHVGYGVIHNGDGAGSFDYLAGVEVREFADLPGELARLRLAPQRYAVFHQPAHISTVRSTCYTIWNKWLPESGRQVADAPEFERYPESFDGRTGEGGYEIWVPLRP